MYYFTGDEHYGHEKILTSEYSDRVARMNVANVEEIRIIGGRRWIANTNLKRPRDFTPKA